MVDSLQRLCSQLQVGKSVPFIEILPQAGTHQADAVPDALQSCNIAPVPGLPGAVTSQDEKLTAMS